jgi:hypothetical protein
MPSPTNDQLVAWFHSGELLDQIANGFGLTGFENIREIAHRSAELAVAGQIDLLAIIESPAFEAQQSRTFFTVQAFFIEVLPNLDEPLPRMLAAVEALVKRGGTDMFASQPNAALRAWLQKNPARAEELLALAGAGETSAGANSTFALEALADPARAREFLQKADTVLRASGITALGRISDCNSSSRLESVRALGEALGDGTDEMVCANVVGAVLAIASQDDDAPADEVVVTLSTALKLRSEGALNRAAHGLWAQKAATQPKLLPVLLEALEDLNPGNKDTIKELEHGLKAAVDTGLTAETIGFLTILLVKHKGRLEAREFDYAWTAILAAPPRLLTWWIVSWLGSGETALGAAVSEVLPNLQRQERRLVLDRTSFPTAAVEQGYLARKAVGWFLLQPDFAVAVLIAVLGLCDQKTARNVTELLIYPILRNYPEVRETLAAVPADDPARPWVDAALQENERYLDALKTMPDIFELRPSEHHRRIHHLHQADTMRSAHKAAVAQSAFMQLVHHSTQLYGVRSLSYVEDFSGGARQPMEMELGKHEVSMMLPRLGMLDPVGMQLMFFHLRSEARPE